MTSLRLPFRPSRSLASLLFTCAFLGCLVTATTASKCTPVQVATITADVTKDLECVAPAVLSGGVTDPLIIATYCGGLTVQEIVNIIDVLIISATADAG